MNYNTKNKIGTALEVAGAVSFAVTVRYDLPFVLSIPTALLFFMDLI